MESLARTVAIIVFTIIGLGVVAAVAVVRPPRSLVGRVAVTVLAAPAIVAGGWFVALDIGVGARVIGGATFVAAVAALVRTWRKG